MCACMCIRPSLFSCIFKECCAKKFYVQIEIHYAPTSEAAVSCHMTGLFGPF